MNRRLCSKCGLDYNLIFHRPASPDTCDVCGGALVGRSDDNAEAVEARLRDYHTKTAPILELFRRKELVVNVDGDRPTADIQAEIREKLGLVSHADAAANGKQPFGHWHIGSEGAIDTSPRRQRGNRTE